MNSFKLLTLTSIAAFFVGCASDDNTYTRNNTREPGIKIKGGGGPVYGEGEYEGGLPTTGADVEDGEFGTPGDVIAVLNEGAGTPVAHEIEPVYFAFDSAAVRPAEDAKIGGIAELLQANTQYTLVIGGHCDERGSDEYNRSLSEKRALAVKESLLALAPDLELRIETVAYGEEKPAVLGADSQSYAKNRRAEFEVYEAK